MHLLLSWFSRTSPAATETLTEKRIEEKGKVGHLESGAVLSGEHLALKIPLTTLLLQQGHFCQG